MTTATDALDRCLAAIADHGERTNAFISVDADGARRAARAVDDERRRGIDRGPLHGMPISIKDLIDIAGQPTTAASRVRVGHVAPRDAIVVQRLRAAGAVLIGKTNLHEFALGPTNDESAFGAVRNPHDLTRVSGGSSGGSAAAVSAGMSVASIGSDTGGSIRIPAAACGVVGLKPSYGDVPVDGVVPLSATLDHVGPLTRTVADAANIWAILADRPVPRVESPRASSITLGALEGYFTNLLSPEVRQVFENALDRLRDAGVTIASRGIEHADDVAPSYVNISLPEAANWHAETMATRAADYQPGVRDRLERGRTIAAVDYLRGRAMQDVLRRDVDAALDGATALVLPTLPVLAPALGAAEVEVARPDSFRTELLPVRAALLRLTQLFNLSGHPAITLPIRADGLPVGLQLVGRREAIDELFATATACERVVC
ncbi:MAG TPA: amidase [Gemmatimonadaceae bacterium]|jgi:aspartyl-tRNA(Asn)/glutamyl-tRNA(Gln) amidotransferase subunit A|nr:amidase [Gemmatimonadaceae bacterium]